MNRQSRTNQKIIIDIQQKRIGAAFRSIPFESGAATAVYIRELTDIKTLGELVIAPLEAHTHAAPPGAERAAGIVGTEDCRVLSDTDSIVPLLLDGYTVLLLSGDRRFLAVDIKHVEKRSIPTPHSMYTMRGPRDCFIESIESNLSLVRYRIKDENLRVCNRRVGRRTKTRVSILYIEDIANERIVREVKKRISAVDTDGIIESGELQAFMLNRRLDLFPQMGIVERSDMACGALLEGKVVVLVDGSEWALVAPKVLSEFLWSCDDYYDNKYLGLLMRVLRVIALFISFAVSSLYVAIVSFHNDVLPSSYMIAIAETRAKVPFNALIEVLLIELIAELIRESLIRVPTKIGAAVGIVGAIIIGQAAVSAGVFSPLLLIVISISLIASFVPSDYTMMSPIRVLKLLLILATGTFGMFGFTLVCTIILANLVSIKSFGVPYVAPFAPFNARDALKSFFYSKSGAPMRPIFLRTKDPRRSSKKKQ